MDADRRAALVQQGKALKAQLADLEVHLQQLDNRLQVRSSPSFCTCMLVLIFARCSHAYAAAKLQRRCPLEESCR
jgi:hypothetical protein